MKKISCFEYYYGNDGKIVNYYDVLKIDWIGISDNYIYIFFPCTSRPKRLPLNSIEFKKKEIIFSEDLIKIHIPNKLILKYDKSKYDETTKNTLSILKMKFL